MNHPYDVTIFYALHESDDPVPEFPAQSISSDRIQVIPVSESDPYNPRAQTLARISEARGTYTIFLDVGDRFSKSLLQELLAAADSRDSVFIMPSQIFQDYHRLVEAFSLLPQKKTLQLDAGKNPVIFPAVLHGLLFQTQPLVQAVQETPESFEREKMILLSLLARNPRFTYAGSCEIDYVLPCEATPQYDVRPLTREWYYTSMEDFLLPVLSRAKKEQGQVPLMLQHLALYMISSRFQANVDNRNRHVIEPEAVVSYTELLSEVLQYVSIEAILDRSVQTSYAPPSLQLLLLRMKRKDWSWYPQPEYTDNTIALTCDGIVFATLDDVQIHIRQIDYRNGCLEIDGSYEDFFPEGSIEIFARFDSACYHPVYNHRYSLTKYFGTSFFRAKTFHISIPIDDNRDPSNRSSSAERILCFQIRKVGQGAVPAGLSGQAVKTSGSETGNGGRNVPEASGSNNTALPEYTMDLAFMSSFSRFADNLDHGYWRFGNYLALQDGRRIHICPSSRSRVLREETALWAEMVKKKIGRKYLPLKIVNFLLQPWFSRQRIWLFMDKIYKGGDSSEYIYKYAAAQKDGIRKYYLLDSSSADYARLQKEGYHPLRRGSIRHRLIFLNADMVIASNSTVFAFNSYSADTSRAIRGGIHFDTACVQHGMSVQKIAIAQQRLRDNTKLYFCASKYEIENLSKPAYDYVGYDALKLTGVPRYDGLKSRAQKILLLSPTWRMNSVLPAEHGESNARKYNPHFKSTSYYRVYNGLINDPRLLDAASRYGYRIQYVLHPLISPQVKDFTRNDRVEIIPSIGDMSYEKLFCEAALMVTDFSGVQFDFAYMRKPVVYLHHHDIPQHYEEGTFFYDTMGFGEICHTNDELIDVLCEYMKNDCRMPDEYRRRADDFFAFSDNNNCERIYPIMLEHEMSMVKKH
ncbi:MAG: CDP-glycerol glycerophosphotransferase family protein [Lachnospiraceae bacterium]|nr:CDP-glycerol glycerophosphotransferase family protein [Lachnospiraceae bacterium]